MAKKNKGEGCRLLPSVSIVFDTVNDYLTTSRPIHFRPPVMLKTNFAVSIEVCVNFYTVRSPENFCLDSLCQK